jgi:hypothetical protein
VPDDFSFFVPPPAASNFGDILAILRLARKYDVPYLRRCAQSISDRSIPHTSKYDGTSRCDKSLSSKLATIVVAAEVGVLGLLPVAYYDICRTALEVLIEHPLWMTLGEKERRPCLVGYQVKIRQHPRIVSFLSVSKNKYHDCWDWTECNRFRLSIGETINPTLLDSPYMNSPLDLLTERDPRITMVIQGLCDQCRTEAKSLHAAARTKCGERLREMFDLPGWKDLKKWDSYHKFTIGNELYLSF